MPNVAMKISGHKTDAMFQRYNITSTADMAEALRRRAAYDAEPGVLGSVAVARKERVW